MIFDMSHIEASMSFSRLIRLCGDMKSVRAVHARVLVSGTGPHQDVQTDNHLLTKYSKLGHIDDALKLFDRMPVRNLVTWTSLISAYSQMGLSESALNCFRSMFLDDRISPNEYTFVAAISACAQACALRSGKEIHGRIFRTNTSDNSFVNNSLVNFYGKCKSLRSARLVFENMDELNTVSFVSLFNSYMQCGDYEDGLIIFFRFLRMGVEFNEFFYGSILSCCAALKNLEIGKQVHCLALKCGVRMDQFSVTSLVNFYSKCGELELASRALREAYNPNVTAWTALIGGCVQERKSSEAIRIFQEMLSVGSKPNEKTFASVLGAFSREQDFRGGIQLHCLIKKVGFDSYTFVTNTVLDFYAKVDCLEDSFKAFCELNKRDVVSWNTMIAGCVSSGCYELMTRVIHNMFSEGFVPDFYTYSSLLSVCGDLPATEWGKQTHCRVIKPGFDSNVAVGSSLIDMYAKCGQLDKARKVFDLLSNKNVVSWNAMIVGYAQHGFGQESLELYDIMLKNGTKPNEITFIGVLSSCGHVGALEEALHYYGSMTGDYGIIPSTDHLACIVSLYARKGQTKEAYDFMRSFRGEVNKVVWRCLLSGCVSNGDLDMAVYAAEKILSLDPDDTSARVMLSNVYADSSMWDKASKLRDMMTMKKETGHSWT